MSTYLQAFKDHARDALPTWQYQNIHAKARNKAGGLAPKPRLQIATLSFDKAFFTRDEAAAWLDANGYDATLTDDDEAWLSDQGAGEMPNLRRRFLADGVTAWVGSSPEPGPVVEAITKALDAIRGAFIFKDAPGSSDMHVDVPLGAEAIPPQGRKKKRKPKPKKKDEPAEEVGDVIAKSADDHYAAMASRIAALDAEAMGYVAKSGTIDLSAWSDNPDGAGIDVHLASGTARRPGHIGFDVCAFDHATAVHDLNLGIPLPDGCARAVRISKSYLDDAAACESAEALLEEAHRILEPGGVLTSEGGDLRAPGFECIDPEYRPQSEQRYMRVAKAAGYQPPELIDLHIARAALEMHSPGAAHEPPTLVDEGMAEIIQKALSPERVVPIMQASNKKRIVYGVVLAPNEFDAHNHTIDPEEIEQAAHRYLTKSRVVGAGHGKAVLAEPVESFIAPMDMEFTGGPYGEQRVTKGSWVLGVKINDAAEWEKVKQGEYTGFSVGGFGLLSPVETATV